MGEQKAAYPTTFGDFLADVRAVEQAAALTRASVTVGEPGSGAWLMQAGVLEATAAFREHPSFPNLEAHVNREYGEFTYANLLKVRGAVCALGQCGAREVDALPVETVATLLNCPGTEVSADMPKPTEQRVDTTPQRMKPPESLLAAALHALPGALNNAPPPQGVSGKQTRRGTDYLTLRRLMEGEGHKLDAVEWAIHVHVEAGRLEAAPGLTFAPKVIATSTSAMPTEKPVFDREQCLLWANESLWTWRDDEHNPKPAPLPEPTEYTMADILDLLVYKRQCAEAERRRANRSAPANLSAAMNRGYEDLLSAPMPSRLTAQTAAGIAVYRRLVLRAQEVFQRALDEDGMLYFVGEVTHRSQKSVEALLALTTEEFAELWNPPAPKPRTQNPPAQPAPADGKPLQSGGRPKLGEGPKATSEEKALRNVYELVRKAVKPGEGAQALIAHFAQNRDFRLRVAEAKREFNDKLFKAALAWIKENPLDQETQSGNVS